MGYKIIYPQGVLEFLRVFTGDERYGRIELEFASRVERGETITMCDFLERAEQKGIQTGIQKGIQTGIQKGIQTGIQKGIQTGIQKGIQMGIQTGIRTGEDRSFRLMEKLVESGRVDEVKRAAADVEYRGSLYREFGI